MQAFKGSAIVAIAMAVLLIPLICGDGIASQKARSAKVDVTDLVAQGKSLLAMRRPQQAWEVFDRVCELREDLPDGHLGIYMADEIVLVDWLQSLVEFVIDNIDQWFKTKGSQKVAGEIIRETIEDFARPLLAEMVDHLDRIDEDFSFYLPEYPLFVYRDRLVCDLGGEWDYSDVLIVRGMARWLLGLCDFLLSYNLDFDAGHIIDIELPPDADLREILLTLVDALLDMLNDPDYPDFLYLSDEGFELLPQAGIEFGRGNIEVIAGFARVLQETDPQEDDIFAYSDENGNSRWDAGEPLVFPYIGRISDDQAPFIWSLLRVVELAGESMLDETEFDTSSEPNPFPLDSINPLVESFGLPPILPAMEIDLGEFYRNPKREQLHDTLVLVLTLIKQFLEQMP